MALTADLSINTVINELSKLYPTIDDALARLCLLNAGLKLPKPTVHVVSDIHGEYKKLRHIVNNGSGSLRLLVADLFKGRLTEKEQLELLSFVYYPRETYFMRFDGGTSTDERTDKIKRILLLEIEIIRVLAKRYPLESVAAVLPKPYLQLYRELILGPHFGRDDEHVSLLLSPFLKVGKDLELLRMTARVVRNLLIAELIVAGDLGDRGSRIDKVVQVVSQQPRVSIVWGNHDVTWMGACLGHAACIANVVRLSLRYGNIAQLEEGYGISLRSLEELAQSVYGSDQAVAFKCKKSTGNESIAARMHKAIAIMQFKLEGQVIERNPHFNLANRNLLSSLDLKRGTVKIDGRSYPLSDTFLPTIDQSSPLKLRADESSCMAELQRAFLESPILWQQMLFVARRGRMYLKRDHTVIFHGCVPVDESGDPLAFSIDGIEHKGRALFDAITVAVQRAFVEKRESDLDLMWYLWCGSHSPLFGKDKIATFESHFIADKEIHKEHKNPYFSKINEREFCKRILHEFGYDGEDGLIVNGHVPVKLENGETPMKKSGMAVTIDGAFSEAYGDMGYTLVLDSEQTYLAQHHHFESIEDSIRNGTDMIPKTETILKFKKPRIVADTEQGAEIKERIRLLELLIKAYRENRVGY